VEKSAERILYINSEGILDRISVAVYFIILAPELEYAFGEANCRFLICLVLYGLRSVMSLKYIII